MRLAKPHLDIGLFTTDIAAHTAFWGETVGLRLDHQLALSPEVIQHRYDAHGSVVKVNHSKTALPARGRSGITALTIASAGASLDTEHPDGDRVRLVPPGTAGVTGIGITISTPEPARALEFYLHAMEFDPIAIDNAAHATVRCGDTLLFIERGTKPDNHPRNFIGGTAFRYLTVQIFDADDACNQIVARGGRLGLAPVSFGEVARYGFVLDPDGNWIEMSARTSLTGVKPPPNR